MGEIINQAKAENFDQIVIEVDEIFRIGENV